MIRELALKNRSYRRFYGEKKIDEKTLRELVDIARNTPSAANRQPLQYRLVCDDETNSRVYDCLGWAGYYKDWDGPVAEERPSAYIIMVTPQDVNPQWDEGIAGQTILLAATEQGFGGCFIGNIRKEKLAAVLNLPEGYKVVCALHWDIQKKKWYWKILREMATFITTVMTIRYSMCRKRSWMTF